MARNKVLERAKVTMPSGRNPFDLSQIRSATALAGELNLCYAQPVVAGTKGKISRKCFTRTADIVSPAFHSVTEHFDFFLVPIHSLWRGWENWKVNINDMQDTNLVQWNSSLNVPDLTLPSYAPRLDYSNLINKLGYLPTTADIPDTARLANDVVKLCEAGGFGNVPLASVSYPARVMNTFIPGAYQKCYFERYRNTAYESNNPYAYNFDWLYDGVHNGLLSPSDDYDPTTPLTKDTYVARQLFRMRRVNYRNDYYHNLYPALNYVKSTPSGIWSLPSNIGQMVTKATVDSSGRVLVNVGGAGADASIQTSMGYQQPSANFSVQNIRAAFALDRLMRASAYAPKHVRDQYKALYGVDGVEDFDMQTERIGSFQSDVVFQEVTNMAQSASANLGDLGAKGLGSSSKDNEKPLSFYAKYDSIIIGLHYFMPRARYDANGFHPWNIKIVREDFYQRAFERLGLRPFYSSYIRDTATQYQIAWTVPNFEYKILPDLNYGAFKNTFTEVYYDDNDSQVKTRVQTSPLSTFVPHTSEPSSVTFTQVGNITADYFKVSPTDLDNIFTVACPDDHRISYFQFYGEFRISVPLVAPMDIHGQPSL